MADINLSSLPPEPWAPIKTFENGWAFAVLDAEGQNIADREVWVDEAALMATVHAFAPACLRYVISSAEKGGKDAKAILDAFTKALTNVEKTPEQITAMRRRAAPQPQHRSTS